jgi:transposase-like protein
MKKIKPIVPTTHMDAAYRGILTDLSQQLDQLYIRHEALKMTKTLSDQEKDEFASLTKPIDQLEKEWNSLIKMYAPSDRAELKRCSIVIQA